MSCDFSFDINSWEAYNNQDHPSGDDFWECPRETHEDEKYCILHLAQSKQEAKNISRENVANQILSDFESDNPHRKRFIGMNLPYFSIRNGVINSSDNFPIVITNCNIVGELNISLCDFSSPIYVEFCSIGSIESKSTEFERFTTFRNLLVHEDVSFRRSRFADRVVFDSTLIYGDFQFSNVIGDAVSFKPSELSTTDPDLENYDPRSSKTRNNIFEGEAKFYESDISSLFLYYVDFQSEVNMGRSSFDNIQLFYSLFENGLKMTSSDVERAALFYYTQDSISFSHSNFEYILSIPVETFGHNIVDFYSAYIRQGSVGGSDRDMTYSFVNATISDVDIPIEDSFFYKSKFEGFDFSKYEYFLSNLNWGIHKIVSNPTDVIEATAYDGEVTNSGWLTTYLRAKNGANYIGDDSIASKFFVKEMIFRRRKHIDTLWDQKNTKKKRLSSFITVINNSLFSVVSRYGEGLGRTIGWSISSILIFSLITLQMRV